MSFFCENFAVSINKIFYFIPIKKASFLSQRNYINNEFVQRLLDCTFFLTFVQERGIPYRPCDLFDEVNYIQW